MGEIVSWVAEARTAQKRFERSLFVPCAIN